VGTQIRGKQSSASSLISSSASRRSVFCFRSQLARIFAASPIHTSCPNSASGFQPIMLTRMVK
jgi:hypothetical protein